MNSTFRFLKPLILAILLLLPTMAFSQDTLKIKERPKVGLVLSGGGAKGAAHIGVIRYIEEAGIPIDYVAGTSMGAIVGGLYALGYTADEMQELLGSVDWGQLISNNMERRKISFSEKSERSKQLLTIPFSIYTSEEEIRTKNFRNSLPNGIVSGDNLINLFNSLAVGYADSLAFQDLPTPFICMATNMLTGNPDALNKGEITKSLRASMAIPILFDPVRIEDNLYADGGLVCNFPAEQCRQMGADYIIGVSMSPGLQKDPDKLHSLLSQVKQLKEIITDKDNAEYHKKCDIFIRPELKGVGMLSFDAESVARVCQSGYDSASEFEEKFIELKNKVTPDAPIKRTVEKKAINILKDRVLLTNIEMIGLSKQVEKWMRNRCRLETGDMINKADIDETISIYYGTGSFSNITYTLHPDPKTPEGFILRIKFVYNPPHDFGLGFRFDTQDMLSMLVKVGLYNNRLNGFKAEMNAKLGGNQMLNIDLSYGHMQAPRINYSYNFRNSEIDAHDEGKLDMNMKYLKQNMRLYLSENYLRNFSLGAGLEVEFYRNRKVLFANNTSGFESDYQARNTLGAFAYVKFDNLDKHKFATRGLKAELNYSWRAKEFNKKKIWDMNHMNALLGLEAYIPVVKDRFTIIPQLYASAIFGKGAESGYTDGVHDLFIGPVPKYAYLNNFVGGTERGRYVDQQIPFIGLNKLSLAYNYMAILRTDFRVRLFKEHYLTAMFNYGRSSIDLQNFFKDTGNPIWPTMYEKNSTNWWGAGIRYSIDTKLGPISLDVSSSNISPTVCIYANIGYYF